MRKYQTLFLFFLLVFQYAYPQTGIKEQLHQLMKTYHQYNMFEGAVLVADNGKIVYQEAFGMANREWNIPNRVDTKFMIGSVSKPLTATLVLVQVQKGLLELDQKISYYLPEFKNKPAEKVTVRQLLNHTSGIANYEIIKDFFPKISRQSFSRNDYLKVFIDSALLFEPGTKYSYSSWGYFTLGYLVERVTGKSYAELMQQDIYDILGMKNSGSYLHTQIVPNRASGYDYSLGGYASADFRDQSNTMGTGDIYSTVEDLFKFHMALTDDRLLNSTLRNDMFTPGIKPADYGFGWFNRYFKLTATDSLFSNFHLGMTDGFISFIRRIPSRKAMVIILCNSSPTDFFGITNNLFKILYKKPFSVKEPVHKRMEKLIASKGVPAAIKEFDRIKDDTAHFYIDWISMNFLAEQLLSLKRLEDARIVAEKNVKEFPSRDLVMYTMGNIYLALNRQEDAIKFFNRTLEISPFYEAARMKLKEVKSQK